MAECRSYEQGTKAVEMVEMVQMVERMKTKAGLRSYEPGTMSVLAARPLATPQTFRGADDRESVAVADCPPRQAPSPYLLPTFMIRCT